MAESTERAFKAIVEFLQHEEGGSTWHPSLFTQTGHRAGTPHAIRKLKAAGLIEIAGRNYENEPLYRRTERFDVNKALPN